MDLKNISLNLYSFGYYAGFIADPARQQAVLGIDKLVGLALSYGLGGVELPFDYFYKSDSIKQGIARMESIRDQGLRVFLDLEKTDVAFIEQLLPSLPGLGIDVIRIKMDQIGKTIYGGNRYASETFQQSVDQFKGQLAELLPSLEKHGVSVAIENHQDFHSSEMAELARGLSEELIGITWDVGNSASVIDSPDSFWETAGHLVKNVHLKDYHIYRSDKGIRMVRCPIGDGYVNYQDVFEKLASSKPGINMSIELGAQITRECDINNSAYWDEYGKADIDRDGFLAFLDDIAMDASDEAMSGYEKGLAEAEMIESELDEVKRSVSNIKNSEVEQQS